MGKEIRFPVISPPDWGEIIEMVQKALQEEEKSVIVTGEPPTERKFVLSKGSGVVLCRDDKLPPSQEDVLRAVSRVSKLLKLPEIPKPDQVF